MTQYIIITGFDESATNRERLDVTVGKSYDVIETDGEFDVDPFFVDDAGEQNFGCDETNSVYLFTIHTKEE